MRVGIEGNRDSRHLRHSRQFLLDEFSRCCDLVTYRKRSLCVNYATLVSDYPTTFALVVGVADGDVANLLEAIWDLSCVASIFKPGGETSGRGFDHLSFSDDSGIAEPL